MDEGSAAQYIRERGWRQGAVIGCEALKELDCPSPCIGWLVVSQSCDLIHHDFEHEPFAEVISIQPIPEEESGKQGNLLYGKNPRILSLETERGWLQVQTRNLQRIPRERLVHLEPLDRLDNNSLRLVCNWLAKRYIRPALPDAFNLRLQAKPHGPRIRKLLKQQGQVVEAMLMTCLPGDKELGESDDYDSILWVVMQKDLYDDPEMRRQGERLVESLSGLLESVKGINYHDCDLRCESEVTLDDLRHFVRWDFDDLTHREEMAS